MEHFFIDIRVFSAIIKLGAEDGYFCIRTKAGGLGLKFSPKSCLQRLPRKPAALFKGKVMVGYPSNVLIIADYPNYRFKEQIKYRVDFVLSCGDVPYQVLEGVHERYGKPIYAVKGNHDPSGPFPGFVRNVHYAVTQERNWIIGGWEGVPAYKPSGGGMFDDFEAASYLANFPYVDIFVTHAPIYGKTDKDDYAHIGSEAILKYIEEKQPKYVYHGHTHQHAGTMIGDTAVVSVYGFRVVHL